MWGEDVIDIFVTEEKTLLRKQPNDMTSLDHSLREEVLSVITVYV